MSLLRSIRPGLTQLVPGIRDRDQFMSVAWRKAGKGWTLSVGFPKTVSLEMGFHLQPESKNWCEVGFDETSGTLFIANTNHVPDKALAFRITNRRGSNVLTLAAKWLHGYTVTHASERCSHSIETYNGNKVLAVQLPDWAAPNAASHRKSRAAAVHAKTEATIRASTPDARPTRATPFHTAATRPPG